MDVEPPQWLITEGDLSIVMPRMEIRITEPSPEVCTVQWRMLSRNSNILARLVVLPLARNVMAKRASTGLDRLKELLERDRTDKPD